MWTNHPNSSKIDQKWQNSSICIELLPIEAQSEELWWKPSSKSAFLYESSCSEWSQTSIYRTCLTFLHYCLAWELNWITYLHLSGWSMNYLILDFPEVMRRLPVISIQWLQVKWMARYTFNGMGIIAVGTRTQKQEQSESVRILGLRSLLKATNITELKNFPVKWYESDELCGLSKITLKPVMQLIQPLVSSSSGIDILW